MHIRISNYITGAMLLIIAVLGIIQPLPSKGAQPLLTQNTTGDPSLDAHIDTSLIDVTTSNLPPDRYYRARVVEITDEGTMKLGGVYEQPYQKLRVEFTTGPDAGKKVTLDYGTDREIKEWQKAKVGETVVVLVNTGVDGTINYYLVDKYRLPPIIVMLIIFFLMTVIFGKLKGFTSILGLGLSVGILVWFIIPKIVAGANPLGASLAGAVMIALISLYLAHGFTKRTSIALFSTILTLGAAVGLAIIAVSMAKLSGLGNEDAFYLQAGVLQGIDVRGLLLGGIIIGALGVLDDVTTGQAAAVDEIQKANPSLSFSELYRRGLSVGKEHIASLVNTLALAYVGASFPLLLLFTTNNDQPIWFLLNGEIVVEEIIRTLVGSTALLLAVPLTTFLAARFLVTKRQ